jgi:hypothetical protein
MLGSEHNYTKGEPCRVKRVVVLVLYKCGVYNTTCYIEYELHLQTPG